LSNDKIQVCLLFVKTCLHFIDTFPGFKEAAVLADWLGSSLFFSFSGFLFFLFTIRSVLIREMKQA